ncbi:unnamed protein product [Caenorhabditis auriculariae]|uniref:Uncharacterized protein n=1 Tax=Caenorhabditis auriculariae TaxID=2777116 RepID=A0A8S1H4S9_9PELO|nr:unnamed protein product [Caenorhabditis auriculariae]
MACSKLWSCTETVINGGLKLFLYSSKQTKLRVAVGDVPGPMVHGCISFVTEADSDDGLPHTLEHLVFMGSTKYPFKGVLDVIANRCLASGTNAWTDQDHTAYTLSTVGSEGFFKVLPVYISHLLTPMLTPSQFATEVHHIDGKGDDAGVVYSEMQDHESEMESIMDRKAKKLLYPQGHPYAVDTGGRLKNLRESCSLEKVRNYHQKNTTIFQIWLLEILSEVEQEHLGTVPSEFRRPFSLTPSQISESHSVEVNCPSDDASRGSVEIHWFAHLPTDLDAHTALHILFDYFAETSVAHFHVTEAAPCVVQLGFTGVPIEKLKEVAPKFFDKTLREHLEESTWDIERMGFLIDQTILAEFVKLETNAHQQIFSHVIDHQLFDEEDPNFLAKRANEVEYLKKLKSEPASFWAGLVKKYLTAPQVTVIGIPDEKLVDKISKEEKDRVKTQRETLGKEGLATKGAEIAEAIRQNTAEHPSAELLDQLIVRNLEAFERFPVQSLNKGSSSLTAHQSAFLDQFPFHANLHNCPTKFVEMFFLLDSTPLTLEQRSLLYIYTDLLFESPAVIDGVQHSAEDVAKLFTKDLIDHSIEVGVSGYYDRFVNLRIKVQAEKYPILAKWAQIFTQGIVFDASRVKMSAQKLASDARERKRDGSSVASTAIATLVYQPDSNAALYDELVLEKRHESLAKMATKDPKAVIAKLEDVRTALFSNGVNAHVICDSELIDVKDLKSDLWKWTTEDKRFGKGSEFKASSGEDVAPQMGRQLVIGVGGSESSFIYQTTVIDADWSKDELIPTMIFAQYLSQCEGPLWRAIRGDGLAYGANIYVKPDRKQITLSLYRCAQPTNSYERTKQIVTDVASGADVSIAEFEGAKRSLVFDMMRREGNVSSAGKLSILNTLRNTPEPFNTQFCQRIWNTTVEEMVKIGGANVLKLFEEYVRSITVHPSKVKEMKEAFPGIEAASVASLAYPVFSKKKLPIYNQSENYCSVPPDSTSMDFRNFFHLVLLIHFVGSKSIWSPEREECPSAWKCLWLTFNNAVNVTVYESRRSGLRVAVADVDGPIVHGYMSFVTEADSDDGLPHTLEHLIFKGSSKFPFNEVLDVIARQCLSETVNALTAEDFTMYMVNTLGSEGFFKVLPVYVDHLLNPLLTDDHFTTEVHHINGVGDDAGVVYSEMQSYGTEKSKIMFNGAGSVLYPEGYPYRVDTGGALPNLRNSTNMAKIRSYHEKNYHTANLLVTVVGRVNHSKLLDIMEEVEKENMGSVPKNFPTPLSTIAVPEIVKTQVTKVAFPSDDVTTGSVNVHWVAESPTEVATWTALELLSTYLCNSSVSPLQRDFVLQDEPLASEVKYSVQNAAKKSMLVFEFNGVPFDGLEVVETRLFEETLSELLREENWDMSRLESLIEQAIRNELLEEELDVHEKLSLLLVHHQVYDSRNPKTLSQRLNKIEQLNLLKSRSTSFWTNLVKKYLVQPHLTVVGEPSSTLIDEERLEWLEKEENSKKPLPTTRGSSRPHKSWNLLRVNNLSSFERYNVRTFTKDSSSLSDQQQTFLNQFPFQAYLHETRSKFVEAFFLFDSSELTLEQRARMVVFMDLIFESPAVVDDVIVAADDELIEQSMDYGVAENYPNFITLKMKVEAEKFELVAKWSKIFTQGVILDPQRIRTAAQRLASEARDAKSEPSTVTNVALASILYKNNSNEAVQDPVLERVFEALAEEAKNDPPTAVVKFGEMRRSLFSNGINAHFVLNPERINKNQMSKKLWKWNDFGKIKEFKGDAAADLEPQLGRQLLSTTLGVHFTHDDVVPVTLLANYFSQGPLWQAIRGRGLAYNAEIEVNADNGLVTLSLGECAQPVEAYEETRRIVMELLNNKNISSDAFEGVKRSMVFKLVNHENTISQAGKVGVVNVLRGSPTPFTAKRLKHVWSMTKEEMMSRGAPVIRKLFTNFVRAISANPAKLEELKTAFPGIEVISTESLTLKPF